MNGTYKVITPLNGEKHIATFILRRRAWAVLGTDQLIPDEQVVKIEEVMQ